MRPGPGLVVMALAFISGARRGSTSTSSKISSSSSTTSTLSSTYSSLSSSSSLSSASILFPEFLGGGGVLTSATTDDLSLKQPQQQKQHQSEYTAHNYFYHNNYPPPSFVLPEHLRQYYDDPRARTESLSLSGTSSRVTRGIRNINNADAGSDNGRTSDIVGRAGGGGGSGGGGGGGVSSGGGGVGGRVASATGPVAIIDDDTSDSSAIQDSSGSGISEGLLVQFPIHQADSSRSFDEDDILALVAEDDLLSEESFDRLTKFTDDKIGYINEEDYSGGTEGGSGGESENAYADSENKQQKQEPQQQPQDDSHFADDSVGVVVDSGTSISSESIYAANLLSSSKSIATLADSGGSVTQEASQLSGSGSGGGSTINSLNHTTTTAEVKSKRTDLRRSIFDSDSPLTRLNPWISACDLAQPGTAPDLQGQCSAGTLPVAWVDEGPGPPSCPISCEQLRLNNKENINNNNNKNNNNFNIKSSSKIKYLININNLKFKSNSKINLKNNNNNYNNKIMTSKMRRNVDNIEHFVNERKTKEATAAAATTTTTEATTLTRTAAITATTIKAATATATTAATNMLNVLRGDTEAIQTEERMLQDDSNAGNKGNVAVISSSAVKQQSQNNNNIVKISATNNNNNINNNINHVNVNSYNNLNFNNYELKNNQLRQDQSSSNEGGSSSSSNNNHQNKQYHTDEQQQQQCLDYLGDTEETSPAHLCSLKSPSELVARLRSLRLKHCCERNVLSALHTIAFNVTLSGGVECVRILMDVMDLDSLATRITCEVAEILYRFDCRQVYSRIHQCDDCKEAYRRWVCSTLVPYFAEQRDITVMPPSNNRNSNYRNNHQYSRHNSNNNSTKTTKTSNFTSTNNNNNKISNNAVKYNNNNNNKNIINLIDDNNNKVTNDNYHDEDSNSNIKRSKRHLKSINSTSTNSPYTASALTSSLLSSSSSSPPLTFSNVIEIANHKFYNSNNIASTTTSTTTISSSWRRKRDADGRCIRKHPQQQQQAEQQQNQQQQQQQSNNVISTANNEDPCIEDPVISKLIKRSKRKVEFRKRRRIRPCLSVCQTVEQKCPYLLPADRAPALPTQYAGEPTFLCLDQNIPETGEQLRRSSYGPAECCYAYCDNNPSNGICTYCMEFAYGTNTAEETAAEAERIANATRRIHNITLTATTQHRLANETSATRAASIAIALHDNETLITAMSAYTLERLSYYAYYDGTYYYDVEMNDMPDEAMSNDCPPVPTVTSRCTIPYYSSSESIMQRPKTRNALIMQQLLIWLSTLLCVLSSYNALQQQQQQQQQQQHQQQEQTPLHKRRCISNDAKLKPEKIATITMKCQICQPVEDKRNCEIVIKNNKQVKLSTKRAATIKTTATIATARLTTTRSEAAAARALHEIKQQQTASDYRSDIVLDPCNNYRRMCCCYRCRSPSHCSHRRSNSNCSRNVSKKVSKIISRNSSKIKLLNKNVQQKPKQKQQTIYKARQKYFSSRNYNNNNIINNEIKFYRSKNISSKFRNCNINIKKIINNYTKHNYNNNKNYRFFYYYNFNINDWWRRWWIRSALRSTRSHDIHWHQRSSTL